MLSTRSSEISPVTDAVLAGFAVVILLEIGGRQGWLPAIAFPWRVTVGTLATFMVGCLFRTPLDKKA